jgi:NAD(P)-dependent dehydrogenase (short-subunit alcohol dehydrogenase family)
VEFIQADHSTVGANSQLGQAVTERLSKLGLAPRLDVLVNNVGGIFATRTVTADGYEATLAVNFLAPVVLTRSVLPLLQASSSPRCVTWGFADWRVVSPGRSSPMGGLGFVWLAAGSVPRLVSGLFAEESKVPLGRQSLF